MKFLLSTLLLAIGAAAELRGVNKKQEIRRHLIPSGTECVTYMRHVDFADGSEEDSWICQFSSSDAKEYGTSAMELTMDVGEAGAISGATLCRFEKETVVQEAIVANRDGAASPLLYLSEDAEFEIVMMDEDNDVRHFRNRRRMRRRLAKGTTGDMRTLVVRTVDEDNKSSDLTKKDLEARVFTDSSCLKSRYHDCSHGKLNIVNGGIVNISINEVAKNNNFKTIENSVKDATYEQYGGNVFAVQEQFDLIMYCQPAGSLRIISDDAPGLEWVAYAYVNGFESFFNNKWCGYVSGQVHEIGHNLGLGHSGLIGKNEYEDTSGMMGYSYQSDNGPDICFNAAKSYQLQWYTENNGVDSVDPLNLPGGSQSFDIIGVADYKTASGLVSLRLEYQGNIANGKEWYIGYNHKSGINSGVPNTADAAPNKVHLIEKINPLASEYAYGLSNRIAALEAGQEHKWTIGDQEVKLVVNSIDGAVASITLVNGATEPPTKAPVPNISPKPTQAPTAAAPTIPPTKEGECILSDGKTVGSYVLIDIQLDDKSGSEFGWRLLQGNDGRYWEGNNFEYQNSARLNYGFCVAKETCYDLQMEDTGGDGICGGNGDCGYEMWVGSKQVVTGDGNFGSGVSHKVCIGTKGHCANHKDKFKYRKRKRNKRSRKTSCKKIVSMKKRFQRKYCGYFFDTKGRARVSEACMVTCGNLGIGPCAFLDGYEDFASVSEMTAVLVEPVDDNVFVHSP